MVSDIEGKDFIGFAVTERENSELLEKFNKGLEEVIESEECHKIMDTYEVTDVSYRLLH